MKPLIIIPLLLIGFNVMGQELKMFPQSGYITDTVKCVMLVSDTSYTEDSVFSNSTDEWKDIIRNATSNL